MADPAAIGEVFRMLQAGRPAEALAASERLIALGNGNARAHMAAGLALRMLNRPDESLAALERAARLDPGDYGAAFEHGVALSLAGRDEEALAAFTRAAGLRPGFAPARHALGWTLHKLRRTPEAVPHLEAALAAREEPRWRLDLAKALADSGRAGEAREQFDRAMRGAPQDALPHVVYGRFCVSQGDFGRAAELFGAAAALDPADVELPMYLAQVELARGRWREGWSAYAKREQRLLYEAEAQRQGRPYVLPTPEELDGRLFLLTAEQGLGDELFFLRFAPQLRARGARLAYSGDRRLQPLLARTGLFERVVATGEAAPAGARTLLTGDLPELLGAESTPPSLAIAPDPARLDAMRRRLERAGPRPWVGVTWRAGTPRHVVSHALHKAAPIPGLFAAMPREGTVVSLQRDGHFEELESASNALQRPIYDFSAANDDLEDALAITALLDRHVGVSNTNMHLAAAAGATAHVLVPFPPEWRWGLGDESPWFPGFRIYRQASDGDWSRAYAVLAQRVARQ